MSENRLIDQERNEYDTVLGRGVSFDVDQTYYKRKPGILGWLKGKEKVTVTQKYGIKEPTLAILDLIAAEQVKLTLNEAVIASEAGMNEAKKLAAEHTYRLAKILALAVMGADYIIPVQHGAGFRYQYNDKQLNELTRIFHTHLKPSKLVQLTMLINVIENLGDFTNSIRLMSANRTMMPTRIEADKED